MKLNKTKSKREKVIDPDIDFSKRKSVHSLNSFWFIFGLVYVVIIANISSLVLFNVPELRDSEIPFVGTEAWNDLKAISAIGPKVTGTKENEVLAVNFLKTRIDEIINKANVNQNLTADHQVASGSFFLAYKPYGMVTAYRKIQNIVVRLEGGQSQNALLVSCHFDTVPGSPGAADDGANCVIMLELLTILSKRETRNQHAVIFVFNGAEETGLRASHGFITQHKWAKDIKAFVNLDAGGSGGKETLFQTGPGNTWLLNHYKAVSRPFAQAVGEEIFQSGIIPSDTDFRIYRDFGNISGMDFAHASKCYRYHTKFDSIDYLSQGVLQRTGENMLNLILSLTNSYELNDVSNYSKNSSAVYFDFLGLIFITYSKEVGAVINFIVVVFSITVPFLTLTKATVNVHSKNILVETLLGFVSVVFGSGFSGLLCYLTAYVLDKMDHSMSWYRHTSLASGIYVTIAVFAHVVVNDLVELALANKNPPISLGLKIQARLNGVNVFWGIITLGITVIGYRAGYLFMIILLFNFIVNSAVFFSGLHNSVHKWIFVHLLGQFFVVLWSSYFYNLVMEMFIPITGRSGSARNPDALIAIICSSSTLFMLSYFIPLTQLLKSSVTKYLTLISIFLISIFLAISTSWGFPYQNDASKNPTVQRHLIVHTARNFFDEHGGMRYSDAGFYFMQWDRHAKKTIEGISIPEVPVHFTEMCGDEVLCGLPLISSRSLLMGGQWLKSSTPKFSDIALMDSHTRSNLTEDRVQFSFSSKSSSLSAIYIRPRKSAELVEWSFSDEIPDTFNKTYFISLANGIETKALNFNLILKKTGSGNEPLLDITLISMRFDRQQEYTAEFTNILKRVPDWAFAQHCIAAVTSYTY